MKTLRPYQKQALDSVKHHLKNHSEAVLVNASVGAGKSLIIAELLKSMEKAGYGVLCITMNSTLIEQNAQTYKEQGGSCGIYCSELKRKETGPLIIFASPHSVVQAIKKHKKLSEKIFRLIVIDECHQINAQKKDSMYMRIIQHFGIVCQGSGLSYRVLGLTGTPYRGKNHIAGDDKFFKHIACDIDTAWLIEQGYLVRPVFGEHDTPELDFSKLKTNRMGNFNSREIDSVLRRSKRLTFDILQEVSKIVENRSGAFIFASSVNHCRECLDALPEGQAAIIVGDTPGETRKKLIKEAKQGDIKYLINVNCLTTGVDVPQFDTVVFLRPTESLVLYTQAIGRGLRLCENKNDALILDYAGNIERHGDIDDPIINQANLLKSKKQEYDYVIPCPVCETLNKETARRCIGVQNNKRCAHYFEFRLCEKCETKNDIIARHCYNCRAELIDPNKRLTQYFGSVKILTVEVRETRYYLTRHFANNTLVFHVVYVTSVGVIKEVFFTHSEKARKYTYHKFIKHHFPDDRSFLYRHMQDYDKVSEKFNDMEAVCPHHLVCRDEGLKYKITQRIFCQDSTHDEAKNAICES